MKLHGSAKKCVFARFMVLVICVNMFGINVNAQEKYSTKELLGYATGIVSWEKKQVGISNEDSLLSSKFLENAGVDGSDWFVIGMSRFGINDNYENYLAKLEDKIIKKYETDGELDEIKATEWHRAILTILSCGGNPTDVGGVNLVRDGIYGRALENSPAKQGLNGLIWSLIALDSLMWKTPENTVFDREMIINEIVNSQLSDGGFALSGEVGEADITAMALQALSPYYNDVTQENLRKCVNNALEFLSTKQQKNGTYETCEATAQVLCALCDLGIDFENDGRFIKDKNVFDGMMEYNNSDGGFSHIIGEDSQGISSSQALIAISAVTRFKNFLRNVYDFSEEFSETQRDEIRQLSKTFDDFLVETNNNTAGEICQKFNELSVDMKRYIRSFDKVFSVSNWENLLELEGDFLKEMSKNETGNGYVYDVENMKEYTFSYEFSDDDFRRYEELKAREITAFDKTELIVLYEKAERTQELENRDIIMAQLENMKQTSEEISRELDDINSIIVKDLYPFENLDKSGLKTLEDIYQRILKLPQIDRENVTAYSELCSACEGNSSTKVSLIIIIFVAVAFVAIIVICVVKSCGRRRNN